MDFSFFNQLLLIFSASIIAIALFHRLQLPATLSYLAVGIILGPTASNLIGVDFNISLLAEIGVVFLLFSLGLEFSIAKVAAMRRQVLGLGGLQVLVCSLLLFGFCLIMKVPTAMAMVFAAGLSLSSTAIVSKELTQRNEIKSEHGQRAIAILIFQDIAAVLFLILVPVLSGGQDEPLGTSILMALGKGGLLVLLMILAGKYLLPPIFHEIAMARSQELFVLTAIVIALAAAWITHSLHLSMALGGFMAGMVLGESHYRHQIESDIRPFRDVLLGLFFVSVGLMLDLHLLARFWWQILLLAVGLIVFKGIMITLLARTFGASLPCSLRTGLSLAQGGEFCFALIALTSQYGLMDANLGSIVLSVTIISMAATPLLIRFSQPLAAMILDRKVRTPEPEGTTLNACTAHLNGHVMICGFGRVGQSIARCLEQQDTPFIALDDDPVRVQEARGAAQPVFYGDCRRQEILVAAGLGKARLVVICIDNSFAAREVLEQIRDFNKEVPVLVRTRDDSDLEVLRESGANEVIPEVLESSLMLVSHVLLLMGKPHHQVRQMMHKIRGERYELLHGYFQGELHEDSSYTLHAVPIAESAHAVGHDVEELKLDKMGVDIYAIRRNDQVVPDHRHMKLQQDDIIVLRGPHDQVEAAEAYLLAGN